MSFEHGQGDNLFGITYHVRYLVIDISMEMADCHEQGMRDDEDPRLYVLRRISVL